jgi:Ribonuclease G/E
MMGVEQAMQQAADTVIDGAIGETRVGVLRAGRVVGLRLLRWSDAGRRARLGEVYVARVRSIDRVRRGAFLDLGLKEDAGFLPLDSNGRARAGAAARALREGEALTVSIVREAAWGKGPVAQLLLEPAAGGPRLLAAAEGEAALREPAPANAAVRSLLDEAFEAALARQAPLANGGVLSLERTSALTVVDVDAGARPGGGDVERYVRQLNIDAAREAAVQLRLRGLGGLCVIDFVHMRREESRKAVEAALREALREEAPQAQMGRISKLGLLELSRPQTTRPLQNVLLDGEGRPTVETAALAALRALEREAGAARGRMVRLRAPAAVARWLQEGHIAWREALTRRIGVRFSVDAAPDLALGRLDVSST